MRIPVIDPIWIALKTALRDIGTALANLVWPPRYAVVTLGVAGWVDYRTYSGAMHHLLRDRKRHRLVDRRKATLLDLSD